MEAGQVGEDMRIVQIKKDGKWLRKPKVIVDGGIAG